jgi:hypothetical protein
MSGLNRRGRASGRARVGHVEFALGCDSNRAGLVESAIQPDWWYLVVGRQNTKVLDLDGTDPGEWRRLDEHIRDRLRHPFQRSDFCHKLLAVFAYHRDYGPAAPLTGLIWEAFGDLLDTIKEG